MVLPTPRSGRLLAMAALLCCALGSGSAQAAQRFAAPGGSPGACSQNSPCDLVSAVGSASSGDEVVLGPGTYTPAATVFSGTATTDLVVHGATGADRPLIQTSADNGVSLLGTGDVLRDVRVRHTGTFSGVLMRRSSTAERVEVRSSGISACTGYEGVLFRDSVCLNTGASSWAVRALPAAGSVLTLRGVTAVATGTGSMGIALQADGGAGGVDARNVIAAGEQADAGAETVVSGDVASIVFSSSNFATVAPGSGPGTEVVTPPGSGDNQTADPLFLDVPAGDLRQQPGSPTINAGTPDALNGSADFEGDERAQGVAIDIGADEADGVAPDTTINSRPPQVTAQPVATFSYASPGAVSAACVLDGAGVPCGLENFTTPSLADGPHLFSVAGRDLYSNLDPSPAAYAFTVDTEAPSTTVAGGPKTKTTSRSATLRFAASEPGATFECRLDRGGFRPCSSPRAYRHLARRRHVFSVRATDSVGNIDSTPAVRRWLVTRKHR